MSNEFKLIDDEILKKLNETMIELETTVYKYDHGFLMLILVIILKMIKLYLVKV